MNAAGVDRDRHGVSDLPRLMRRRHRNHAQVACNEMQNLRVAERLDHRDAGASVRSLREPHIMRADPG